MKFERVQWRRLVVSCETNGDTLIELQFIYLFIYYMECNNNNNVFVCECLFVCI